MAKVQFKKKINVMAVVGKLFGTLLGLWVGGTLMTNLAQVMEDTCSPFYSGLSLIGWTPNATNCLDGIYPSTSASGVLGIIGLVGIASVVLEFVYFKL